MTFLTLQESFIYFNGTWFLDFIIMIFTVNLETLNTQKVHLALFQNMGWYRLNRGEKKFTYIRGNIFLETYPLYMPVAHSYTIHISFTSLVLCIESRAFCILGKCYLSLYLRHEPYLPSYFIFVFGNRVLKLLKFILISV